MGKSIKVWFRRKEKDVKYKQLYLDTLTKADILNNSIYILLKKLNGELLSTSEEEEVNNMLNKHREVNELFR